MRSDKPATDDMQAPVTQKANCDIHGDFDQRICKIMSTVFRSPCPKCSEIAKAKEEADRRAREDWDRKRNLDHRLGSAAIPKRFVDKTFAGYRVENPGQKKALEVATRYAESFADADMAGRCLLMVGKPGTGKTHLAAAIANHVMHAGKKTAAYRTVGGVLQAIRETYNNESTTSEGKIISGLVSADLLILDEVGLSKAKTSDHELMTLFSIINGRYEEIRPTIIVSNLEAQELAQAMGERTADRLREGGVIVLPFNWESQRSKECF